VTTASSLAKEIGNFSTVDTNRAYSNGRGGKNECGNGIPEPAGRICALIRFIGHEYG